MKTLLRKTSSAVYFQGPDQWTQDPSAAFNFKSIDHALRFIRQWALRDVELVFAFQDDKEVTEVDLQRLNLGYTE